MAVSLLAFLNQSTQKTAACMLKLNICTSSLSIILNLTMDSLIMKRLLSNNKNVTT